MMKVLLVDDETPVLNPLTSGIPWKQLGLQVCGCLSNGAEAFAYMKEHPVDILITDIRMPGMDGLELCRRVRENNQAVQLILLTGYADFNYAKQAIGLQVTEYCLKPVDIPQLTELLRKTVRRGYSGRGSSHADALQMCIRDRSTIAVMRPFGEVVVSPFEVCHTASELSELARLLKSLDGETRVVMERCIRDRGIQPAED